MRFIDATVLVALLGVALIWPLRSPPIAMHGEAREGLVIQDIVARGHWVLPRRNGELPSKPPLYHWIAAGGAAAGGSVSDAIVRLPSALAAAVIVLATFAFAVDAGGRLTAWLSVAALLGMSRFWSSASEARVDMLFAACVCVALVAFFLWYRRRGRLARAVCYLAATGAVLTKGPAGAVLPALVIIVFVVRERWHGADPRAAIAAFWSTPLATIATGIVVGWYALAYGEGGHEFVALQVVRENADRFLGHGVFTEHGGRSRLSMVRALSTDLLPWNLVLPWAAFRWARGAREDDAGRFLHAWWLVILAFFTIAYGKRDVYLLPLYPAIALLVGRALVAAIATTDRERLFGVVPVPDALRRRFPARPALALLAVVLIAFDMILMTVGQLVRENRARQRSLVPFSEGVAKQVPAPAPLFAAPELSGSDLQVLAYRLARPIARSQGTSNRQGPCAVAPSANPSPSDTYYLLPAEAVPAADSAGVVLQSHRRGVDVVLLRSPLGPCPLADAEKPAAAVTTPPAAGD